MLSSILIILLVIILSPVILFVGFVLAISAIGIILAGVSTVFIIGIEIIEHIKEFFKGIKGKEKC